MRRFARIALTFFGLLIAGGILIYGFFVLRSAPMETHSFFRADDGILVIAHQGGDGERPSNTMDAFNHAVEIGADVLEMDIHSTSDGILVTIHDATVDRTTDGTGRVNEFTFEALQALDAGYDWPTLEEEAVRTDRPYRGQGITIPSLEEVLATHNQMRFDIEIKQEEPSIVQPLCDMLRAYGVTDRTIVASFKPQPLYAFREACPDVATSAVEEEIRPFFALNLVGLGRACQPTAESFQVPEYSGDLHVVTQSFVDNLRIHNVMVQPWTINDEETMRRMIDLKVNGITTDYPSRLITLLTETLPDA